jgi:hypothetical protein
MIEELEGIWKEAAITYLWFLPDIYLDGLRKPQKSSVSIADVPAEIQTEHLPNASLTAALTSSVKYLKVIFLSTRNSPIFSFH